MLSLLGILDLIGTIAFAISGAVVAIRKRMDIFGVNVLAVTTATGGGMIRDIVIGNTPPLMFRNPSYVALAIVTANVVFLYVNGQRKVSEKVTLIYDKTLFWFDTVGLAAFTVDGVIMGINSGHKENLFLLVFLGYLTGVGGGAVRDIMAAQMPDIFRKHIYALASIAGGILTGWILQHTEHMSVGIFVGASAIVLIRVLAAHYKWNLPKIQDPSIK